MFFENAENSCKAILYFSFYDFELLGVTWHTKELISSIANENNAQ